MSAEERRDLKTINFLLLEDNHIYMIKCMNSRKTEDADAYTLLGIKKENR